MDRDFWLARWQSDQIGFHQAEINAMLQRYWPRLGIDPGGAAFVPMCGKSLDMRFLAQRGHPVIGVELSELAVCGYFEQAGEDPKREAHGAGFRFEGKGTTLYCGDYFELGATELAAVRGVFDRAALIALPPPMRRRYVEHALATLPRAAGVQILLLTIEYDQQSVAGPPFSVGDDEVRSLYAGCEVELLEERPAKGLPPKFAGLGEVVERAYRIALGTGIAVAPS